MATTPRIIDLEQPQPQVIPVVSEQPNENGEFSSPLAGALYCASRDIPQIPLHSKSKVAILSGWQNLATKDTNQIKRWAEEHPGCNFASVAQRNGVMIFETDSAEPSRRFGKKFTSMFAVQSSTGERGHRYYKNNGMASIAQADSQHRDFSLRANNAYCVSPGSFHPDGPQYKLVMHGDIVNATKEEVDFWESERKPDAVKPQKAETSGDPGFEKLFDIVGWQPLIDRLSKHSDSRFHDPVFEAGKLMYCPMPGHYKPEDAEITFTTTPFGVVDGSMLHCFGCEYNGDMVAACNELDNNIDKVGLTVSATMYDTARAICKENGLRFEDFFPEKVAVTDDDESEVVEEPLPVFPKFSGSLMQLCDSLFPEIPYEFKMMAAVTHFGLIRSGLDKLESEPHLQPRFYTCFIKSPGWGKTAALNEIRKYMGMVAKYCVTSSVDSGPALVDEFADCAKNIPPLAVDRASRLLLDPDEMSGLFEKSKVSPSSRNTLFNEMLKLYEANRTGNRSRKSGKSQVEHAHLAIIGGATEEGYPNMWTGTGGGSTGLQSRMVLITTSAPRMPISKSMPDTTGLADAILRLQEQAVQPGQVIRINDAASKMLQDWWSGSARDKSSETRVEDMVKRLLIVLAVTNDTTTVGTELMAQAIQFGDYVIAVREKFNPADSHSWTQAFENQIIAVAQRRKIAMTMNDYRRMVQPNRKPGGLGPFISAWKNLLAVGMLKLDGKTIQGTGKYRL